MSTPDPTGAETCARTTAESPSLTQPEPDTGLAFGLHPPGYYGMHWVLEVHFGGGGRSFGISVQG